ncbi:MAG: alpha/beta hydrolase [Anaerolineae bacterium]|nr:alpha/beta hydrolase [Anaerolineae bacterium]
MVTDQGLVHYEAYGRGKPVILLHCWLGSWSYWLSTMEALSKRYKTYALDFWGFGESAKSSNLYNVPDYVQMVTQFMERLGLEKAPVMGHSMGGTVSLSLALTHPERVQKVAVVGSPIAGDGLALLLKLAAKRPLAALAYNIPGVLPVGIRIISPLWARDWKTWYAMFEEDLSRTSMHSFHYSIASLRATDLTPRLGEIRVPVLGIYGNNDRVVNPNQGQLITKHAEKGQVTYFEKSGHFPMLDEREKFHQVIETFLENSAG